MNIWKKLKFWGKTPINILPKEKLPESPKPESPKPESPKPEPISCIAQCILDDLDVKNEKDWKHKHFVVIFKYCTDILYSKKYNLKSIFSFGYELLYINDMELEISSKERELITTAIGKIISIKNERIKNRQKQAVNKKLAQLFPECFEKHYIKLPPKPKIKQK